MVLSLRYPDTGVEQMCRLAIGSSHIERRHSRHCVTAVLTLHRSGRIPGVAPSPKRYAAQFVSAACEFGSVLLVRAACHRLPTRSPPGSLSGSRLAKCREAQQRRTANPSMLGGQHIWAIIPMCTPSDSTTTYVAKSLCVHCPRASPFEKPD